MNLKELKGVAANKEARAVAPSPKQTAPQRYAALLHSLAGVLGGFPISTTSPDEWLNEHLAIYSDATGRDQHEVKEQVRKLSNENTHQFNPTYITNSGNGRPVPWILPEDVDPLPLLQSYAVARGWVWFELHGERHVFSDGVWVLQRDVDEREAREVLNHLRDHGATDATARGQIMESLKAHWSCGRTSAQRRVKQLFGDMTALCSQLPST